MDEKTLQIIRENRALGIEEEVSQDRGYRWEYFCSPHDLVDFLNKNNVEVINVVRCSGISYELFYREG